MKKFEKVNQSNIFLYHVIEKLIFYKFIIFWRIPKSSKMNSDFPPTANAQPSKKAYSLYLWPRSKCWIRANRASIQHAATKVTNIGYYIPCRLCFGYLSKFRIYFWRIWGRLQMVMAFRGVKILKNWRLNHYWNWFKNLFVFYSFFVVFFRVFNENISLFKR